MPLPQPNQNTSIAELVEVAMEGFKLMSNVLEAVVEYLHDDRFDEGSLNRVDDYMEKLKEFVNG